VLAIYAYSKSSSLYSPLAAYSMLVHPVLMSLSLISWSFLVLLLANLTQRLAAKIEEAVLIII
jgi:hypothetical protein